MTVAVGIDVGGPRKGFHAVALRGRVVLETRRETSALVMAQWCAQMSASAVAVDSPAGWGHEGGLRCAERQLRDESINFYVTPTKEQAAGHPFYVWMFSGHELYSALKSRFPKLGRPVFSRRPVCFETFPHAVVMRLTNGSPPLGTKVASRRQVLQDAGVDAAALSNVDFVDAGLCAVVASRFLEGQVDFLGDKEGGYLVLPCSTESSTGKAPDGLRRIGTADSLRDLAVQLDQFAKDRDWGQFHSPKDLASALVVEAGELLEHFQWIAEQQSRRLTPEKCKAVAAEIGDVLLYLIQLSTALGIDPIAAAQTKLKLNELKYPVDRARRNSKKHDQR